MLILILILTLIVNSPDQGVEACAMYNEETDAVTVSEACVMLNAGRPDIS